jgi:hypothetical protein
MAGLSYADSKHARLNAWRTAIRRQGPSAPFKRIRLQGLLPKDKTVLDYGCGRGQDADEIGADKYDPFFYCNLPEKTYDIVLCTYVMNVIPPQDDLKILHKINDCLNEEGVAYITVRRDCRSLNGMTKRGTFQRKVNLPFEVMIKDTGFITYKMSKNELIKMKDYI